MGMTGPPKRNKLSHIYAFHACHSTQLVVLGKILKLPLRMSESNLPVFLRTSRKARSSAWSHGLWCLINWPCSPQEQPFPSVSRNWTEIRVRFLYKSTYTYWSRYIAFCQYFSWFNIIICHESLTFCIRWKIESYEWESSKNVFLNPL